MFRVLLLSLTIFMTLSFVVNKLKQPTENPSARVWIVQGNKRILVANQDITLSKKPFRFEVEITGAEGIYLHAAQTDTAWQRARLGQMPYQLPFSPNVMAEESFNAKRTLLIDDLSLSYWFFDPELAWHRFDKGAKIEAGIIKARKSVRRLWLNSHNPDHESTVKIADFSGDLYLVFMVGTPVSNDFFAETTVHQVTYTHIVFR